MIEAQERLEKSPKKVTSRAARCGSSGGLLIYIDKNKCSCLNFFFTLPPNGPSKMSSLQVLRGSKHFIHFNVVRSFTLHSPFKIVNFGHWAIVPCGEEIWYCNRPEILKINLVLLMVVDFKSMNDQITWMYEFTWPMDTWRSYWGMRHHDHASLQHFRVSFIIENIGT